LISSARLSYLKCKTLSFGSAAEAPEAIYAWTIAQVFRENDRWPCHTRHAEAAHRKDDATLHNSVKENIVLLNSTKNFERVARLNDVG
jgi:hypothetical protein